MLSEVERHNQEHTVLSAWESLEPKTQRSYVRHYIRKALQIPTCLQLKDRSISCHTQDVSPGGLRILSSIPLASGKALALKFAFGDNICFLNISGQVVYNLNLSPSGEEPSHAIGIKFSDIQDWEQIILISLVDELLRASLTREKSLLTILVSRDSLADEAAHLFGTPVPVHDTDEGLRSETAFGLPSSLFQPTKPLWSDDRSPSLSPGRAAETETVVPDLDLPTFTLLINGKPIDTRQYKYVVSADKLLTDAKSASTVLKQIRRGQVPQNYKDFLYARYCIGKKDTNQLAIQAAYEASQEFRHSSLSKRLKIAAGIHELLLLNKEPLIELMILEGHPRKLAEWEFSGMEQIYRKPSLDFYKRHLSQRIGVAGTEILYWKRKPDGVVCVSPPRNAPCSGSIIAGFALLAGNTLIIKPPLNSPLSTMFLWNNIVHESLKAYGAPAGTLNVVLGNSEVIMNEWITSPYVNDLLFIGDSKVGLAIGSRAFQNGKKPILELSGNDMMFIWKDAVVHEAVRSLLDGFMGSTQICMVPKKAFIHEELYESFQSAFLSEIKTLRVGLPSDPNVSLSPVIKIPEFFEFLEDALAKGAELLCGGYRVDYLGQPDRHGQFLAPTVVRIKDLSKAYQMKCMREENFFPLIPLIRVTADHNGAEKSNKDMAIFKKMVHIANNNEYGLRISAWVTSPFYASRFSEQIQNSGLLRINSRHVGFPPFLATHGGTGKSGGPFGELNYVWQKTTHLQGVSLTRIKKRDE